MPNIRVLIADDHAIVRTGLRLLLSHQQDIEVVGEAGDGRECVDLAAQLQPDVVLMDISMPVMNGMEATKIIKERQSDVQVLGLTMHDDDVYFFQLLNAGASGYVLKGASPDELLSAIRAVAQGQAYIYPTLTRKLLDDYIQRVASGEEQESYGGLTEREKEVLKLIAEGHTSRQIADILYLSVNTVERHRSYIMDKLNLHNKADLIKYAIRKGLVKLEE